MQPTPKIEVHTIRFGSPWWLGKCANTLDCWCRLHGHALRVWSELNISPSYPCAKFCVVDMLRQFLEGDSDWIFYIDADVYISEHAPAHPEIVGKSGIFIRDEHTFRDVRNFPRWCNARFGSGADIEIRGWQYCNAGVWLCDRGAARKLLSVIKEPFHEGVQEQHHWNWWLNAAAKHEGLVVNMLDYRWNRRPPERSRAHFYHWYGTRKIQTYEIMKSDGFTNEGDNGKLSDGPLSLWRIHSCESRGAFQETIPAFESAAIPLECYWGDRSQIDPRQQRRIRIPAMGVWTFEGGGTLGKDCWTIESNGNWVADLGGIRRVALASIHLAKNPTIQRTRHIRGTCLDLGSWQSSRNYGHWIFDALGRMAVFERSGMTWDDVDWIRLPIGDFVQCHPMLAALGFPMEKLVVPQHNHSLLTFDRLIRPTQTGDNGHYHSALADYFRANAKISTDGPEKVYVRRSGRRRPLNQDELERALCARGFTVIEPAEAAFDSFANASVIVAPHSAGLGGLVLNRPGTKVLEINTTTWQRGYFSTLSRNAGHKYHTVIGKAVSETYGDNKADFNAPIPSVMDWVDYATANP